MCGIAGFVNFSRGNSNQHLRELSLRMARSMRHRGPDDEGVWTDERAGVALAMRRLAILDTSAAGHQPMQSQSGRYVLVTNGELYNFRELREELSGLDPTVRFIGHSDTEVMLAAFEHWGVNPALMHFNGMFAFALWDRLAHVLHLGRDRFGEKPLYYSRTAHGVLFGSELKALRAHPDFNSELDRGSIALYLRYNCIPSPFTVFRGTAKLPPGTLLSLREGSYRDPTPFPWWSAADSAMESLASPFQGSEDDAAETLDAVLRDAVRIRMRSDVPLGALLSGGVDSSTVVALMQAQSTVPVQTFSIGVHDTQYNEAAEAARVAQHLSTNHTELYVTPAEAMAVIPGLAAMYDEPFADSSQIPTCLVARLARQKVTVCLSGDGGDELFGGYNRHVWCEPLLRVPGLFRKSAASALTALPPPAWDTVFDLCRPLMPKKCAVRMPGYKLHKLAAVLSSRSVPDLYTRLRTHWDPGAVLLSSDLRQVPQQDEGYALHPAERMMLLDTATYLPDDILAKLDRATMAVGLEARVPFLDPRVFEFAWRLPLSMKVRNRTGKWVLRKVLSRYVPNALVDRPKAGFGIPLDRWLAGPLRDWCEDLVEEHRLRQQGIFDPTVIRRTWEAYLAGQTFWTWHLWDVLMFQSWLQENTPTHSAAEPCCLQPLP